MEQTIAAIGPVFGLIALGWAAARTGYVGAAVFRGGGALVMKLGLPALIVMALAGSGRQGLLPAFLLAYGAASLAAFAVVLGVAWRGFGWGLPQASAAALGASISNSGYVGYSVAATLMGIVPAGRILAHTMVVELLVMIPLALILGAAASGRGAAATVRRIGIDLLANPLILALAAGVALAWSGLELPEVAAEALGMLAAMSAPVALLVIGGALAGMPLTGMGPGVLLIAAGKLVLHPLAAIAAFAIVPGVPADLAAGGILFASVAMVTIYPLLAERIGGLALAAPAVLVTTLASAVSITLAIRWLGLA